MAIEKIFPSNRDAVIYAAVIFMQTWVEVHKEIDKAKTRKVSPCLIDWMGKKDQHVGPRSDIIVF